MKVNKVKKVLKRKFYKIFWRLNQQNEMESVLLRRLFKSLYGVEVGMYSYGCFDPSRFDPYTIIGRYCSISATARRMNGNHGKSFLTLHPYAYNVSYGMVKKETIERVTCVIEDDAWIGHNAIILPSVTKIGRGSIVGAGTVVTKNVPDYAIVVGNPGVIKGYRFDQENINKINRSEWWKMDKKELANLIAKSPDMVFSPENFPEIRWGTL